MKRSGFLPILVVLVCLPALAADEQIIAVTSSSAGTDEILVKANLQGKPTKLVCYATASFCSAPSSGEYRMTPEVDVDAVYQDCSNVVLYRFSGKTKEKIGVYCALGDADCYMSPCRHLKAEIFSAPLRRAATVLPITEPVPPHSLLAQRSASNDKPQAFAGCHHAVLLHGDPPLKFGEATGAIHGIVISSQGQPVKGVLVTAHWVCPESCFATMSSTTTDEAGEYRFEPVTFGEYAVFVGLPFDLGGLPSNPCATPLTDYTVELSTDHPEAEVRFQLCERVPPKNKQFGTGVTVDFVQRWLSINPYYTH